jgi:hypothetical protein
VYIIGQIKKNKLPRPIERPVKANTESMGSKPPTAVATAVA